MPLNLQQEETFVRGPTAAFGGTPGRRSVSRGGGAAPCTLESGQNIRIGMKRNRSYLQTVQRRAARTLASRKKDLEIQLEQSAPLVPLLIESPKITQRGRFHF